MHSTSNDQLYIHCTFTGVICDLDWHMWPALLKQGRSCKAEVSDFTCTVAGINNQSTKHMVTSLAIWPWQQASGCFQTICILLLPLVNNGTHSIVLCIYQTWSRVTDSRVSSRVESFRVESLQAWYLSKLALSESCILIASSKNSLHCWFFLNKSFVTVSYTLIWQSRSHYAYGVAILDFSGITPM